MTGGSHLSVVAGAGERRWVGGGCWAGWVELWCWFAVMEKVKRAAT
jgi:hypothetical protein